MFTEVHLIGGIITFFILSGFYEYFRSEDEHPLGDIIACVFIFFGSVMWIVFVPLVLGIFMVYVWIRLIACIFNKGD